MKKTLTILLSLLLCLSLALAGCTKPAQTEEPAQTGETQTEPAETPDKSADQPAEPEEPAEPAITTEDQIAAMVASRGDWLTNGEVDPHIIMYGVTDLDEDGNLELVRTWCEGSGAFSSNAFWEFDPEAKAMTPVKYDFEADNSGPDLVNSKEYRCYTVGDTNYLMVEDIIHNGYAATYYVQEALALKDDAVEVDGTAWCMALYEDANYDGTEELRLFFYSGDSPEIDLTPQTYIDRPDEYFANMAADQNAEVIRREAHIEWVQLPEGTNEPDKNVEKALSQSQQAFGFREEDDSFWPLLMNPIEFYLGEDYVIYGMEEPDGYTDIPEAVFGEWYPQQMERDGAVTYFGEGDWNATLYLAMGGPMGMLTYDAAWFEYTNSADERDHCNCREMPVSVADGRGEDEGPISVEFMDQYQETGGINRFIATPSEDGEYLELVWFWWPESDPGAEPVITNFLFSKAAG